MAAGAGAAVLAIALTLASCTSDGPAPGSRPTSSAGSFGAASSTVARSPSSTGTSSAAHTTSAVVTRPTGGAVLERVTIPSTGGFAARPALVYLPAAALRHPTRRLPVLELLHGVPGEPVDWINGANVIAVLDAFAASHHQQTPIVVMPDINGSHRADSECIRTADGGDVERYLTRDVVHWVQTRFAAAVGHERWWLAGLSEGGLCSAMLALRHPHTYSAFGDFSGEDVPAVEGLTAAASARRLYGGNRSDQLAHEPLWLLAHHRYPGLPAWFDSGLSDRTALLDQARMALAARAAGLTVHVAVRRGRHAWVVWAAALRALLPWLWSRR